MKNNRYSGLYKFIIFFMLISFVVTCSFILFFHYLEIDYRQLKKAAPVTFGNVVFITLIFWGLDNIRRRFFTDRPVKRITKGLEKIAGGDFTQPIDPFPEIAGLGQYNEIIAYINKMTKELSGVETLRTDFVSNVSHEMKTPLAVIKNYAQLLQSGSITCEERLSYAQSIAESTDRLSSLVVNILKLNKLENQQIYPQTRTYDLSQQLCESLLDFEAQWERKHIEIETDIEDGVMITADPELLSPVWHNLISNAIKFTQQGGTVRVTVKTDNELAYVTVSDTGCGMDRATGQHIFEKFYQGDTSHASQGNGLGLALVKRIIDITEAEISVESEIGKGSTFTIKLRKGDNNG